MRMLKLLYIISKAPYSNASGQEALDAALIGASFDQSVSLLFLHDGVFQLKAEQDTETSNIKEFTKGYRALNDFGIEDVFCLDVSLAARGLRNEDMMLEVQVLDSPQVADLVTNADKVFTF